MSVKDIVLAAAGQGGATGPADKDPYYTNTVLLLQGDVSNPSLSYNAFSDASGNNVSVLPYGEVRGAALSPYNTSWGVQFSSTRLQVNTTSALDLTGDFTVECWIYPTTLDSYDVIFDTSSSGTAGSDLTELWITSSGTIEYYARGSILMSSSSGIISTNRWHHIVLTRNGNTQRIFVDGTQVASTTSTTSPNTGYNWYIGDRPAGAGSAQYPFSGVISNFRVVKGSSLYSSAFTPPTTPLSVISGTSMLVCAANRFIDLAGIVTVTPGSTEKITSAAPFADSDTTTGSYFNPSSAGSFAASPYSTDFEIGSSDYTIEMWAYIIGDGELIGAFNISSPFPGWLVGTNFSTGNKIAFYHANGSTSQTVTGSNSLGYNRWVHIALAKSGSTLRMYINGVLDSTHSLTLTSTGSNQQINFGADANSTTSPTRRFNGYISDLRITKGQARYTGSSFTLPTSPTSADANTKFLAFQTRGAARNIGFQDSSEFNRVISAYGGPAQGSFSPFSQDSGKWSVQFDGSSYLTASGGASFNPANTNWTFECWAFRRSGSNYDWLLSGPGTNSKNFYIGWIGTTFYLGDGSVNNLVAGNTGVAGKWVHVAVVKDGSQYRAYIDGIMVDSTTSGLSSFTVNNFIVGAYIGGGAFMNGWISNLRLVSGSVLYSGTSTTAANFVLPTGPLTSISGTVLLTCRENRFRDLSPNGFSFAPTEKPSVSAFGPFVNAATYSPSVNGGSVFMDGSGDYVATTIDQIGTRPFCIEMWLYNTVQNNQPIFDIGDYSSGMSIRFEQSGPDRIHGIFNNTGIDLVSDPNPNQWAHFALTRDSSGNLRAFYNGVLTYSGTFTGAINNTDLSIGRINGGGVTGNSNYTGYVSDFRIILGQPVYTTGFTPPTAPLLPTVQTNFLCNFTNGGVIDATGRNVVETLGSASVSTAVKKYGNASIYLSNNSTGHVDFLRMADGRAFTFDGDFTVEMWMYPFTLNTSYSQNSYSPLIDNETAVGSGDQNWFVLHQQGQNLYFATSGGSTSLESTNNPLTAANQWYHVALTRSGSTMRIFCNGVQVASGTVSGTLGNFSRRTGIGSQSSGRWFKGMIDDLRVTRGVARYTSTFTPPTKSLPNQ